jgi:hypothetical protein
VVAGCGNLPSEIRLLTDGRYAAFFLRYSEQSAVMTINTRTTVTSAAPIAERGGFGRPERTRDPLGIYCSCKDDFASGRTYRAWGTHSVFAPDRTPGCASPPPPAPSGLVPRGTTPSVSPPSQGGELAAGDHVTGEAAAAEFRTAIRFNPDLAGRLRLNSLRWPARIVEHHRFLPEKLNISTCVSLHHCLQTRVLPCAMARAISSHAARIARLG